MSPGTFFIFLILFGQGSAEDVMKIFLNHVGYVPSAQKAVIIQAPSNSSLTGFTVYNAATRQSVLQGSIQPVGAVSKWKNWYFWKGDFSSLNQGGKYFIAVDGIQPPLVSHTFAIDPDLYGTQMISDILHYLKGQRCTGLYDIVDHSRPVWGSNLRLDVHGGWYDASGDCSKYMSHLSYANFMNPQQTPQVIWNLIDGRSRLPPQVKFFDERLIDEALHGADFLIRMQDPSGFFYMTVFDKWSKDENQRDICSYATESGLKFDTYEAGYRHGAGVAIAALARASQLSRDGESFTRIAYLDAARRAFAHLEEHNVEYLDNGVENIIDDYCALLAATELLHVTGETQYADAATRRASNLLARQQPAGWFMADSKGERSYFHAAEAGLPLLALMRYLEVQPNTAMREQIRNALHKAFEHDINITFDEVNNPFGYPRQRVMQPGKAERTQFFIPHENPSGYWWQGENARLGSIATAAARGAKLFEDEKAFAARIEHYGQSALDWILGANPYDSCMLQGWGHNNPRYESGYFNAPGGICNGPTGGQDDEDDIDFLAPEMTIMAHSWRWNEQWAPHGAWFFLAVCSRQGT